MFMYRKNSAMPMDPDLPLVLATKSTGLLQLLLLDHQDPSSGCDRVRVKSDARISIGLIRVMMMPGPAALPLPCGPCQGAGPDYRVVCILNCIIVLSVESCICMMLNLNYTFPVTALAAVTSSASASVTVAVLE